MNPKRGYLLDTCILRFWLDESSDKHAPVCGRIEESSPDGYLFVSAITLGEIRHGLWAQAKDPYSELEAQYERLLREQIRAVLGVTRHTALYYGPLRGRLFEKYAPKEKRTKKKRPEQLIHPITGERLGIDENDLWLVSQAIERRLVFVTDDAMDRIRDILAEGSDLQIQNWARP